VRLFWRGVERGPRTTATQPGQISIGRVHGLRRTEIAHKGIVRLTQKDIGRAQVAMDDAPGMSVDALQRTQHIQYDLYSLRPGQRTFHLQ
jgi:hypothetical protein